MYFQQRARLTLEDLLWEGETDKPSEVETQERWKCGTLGVLVARDCAIIIKVTEQRKLEAAIIVVSLCRVCLPYGGGSFRVQRNRVIASIPSVAPRSLIDHWEELRRSEILADEAIRTEASSSSS